MQKPSHAKVGAAVLVAVGVLATLAIVLSKHRNDGLREKAGVHGVNVLAGAPQNSIQAALAQMRWEDIALTAEAAVVDPNLFDLVLRESSGSTNAPSRYLGALLRLAKGEGEASLRLFESIPLAQIPAEHLYAPYRLHDALRHEPAPYLPPLRNAIRERRLSALTEARVRAQEGEFQEAVQAYLRTDPAQWTGRDITWLTAMRQHDGVRGDANRLLRGALRAGRISPAVRTNLVQALTQDTKTAAAPALNARLAALLERDPGVRVAAVKAATNQLAIRRTFANRHYGELLGQFQAAEPQTVPDETVLLLVLSSARQGDRPAFDRWSQELKRRAPTGEVSQWVREIKASIP